MAEMDEFLSQLTGAEIDAAVLAILGRVLVSFNNRKGPYITPQFGDYTPDLIDVSSMRIPSAYNLEKGTLAELLQVLMSSPSMPTGTIISYMGYNAPVGFLACDGMEYVIADYPNLAEQIKSEFGQYNHFGGDGTHTFAVPDLRGEFLRGTGIAERSTGKGGNPGEHQNPTIFPRIANWATTSASGSSWHWTASYPQADNIERSSEEVDTTQGTSWGLSYSYNNFSRGGVYVGVWSHFTSRPTNTAVLYCIKY